jgi:hypothetical protein
MGQNPESPRSQFLPVEEGYVFEHHFPAVAIDELWQLTKSPDQSQALSYHQALVKVNTVEDRMFFYRPFYVGKSDGSQRLIFYARDEMATVHLVLADWLRANTPYQNDYCYQKGRGVEEAIQFHRPSRPRFGYIFDLRHAYMSITKTMLTRQMELLFGRQRSEAIAAAADFMTVAGKLREGTVTAPFAFNLAIHPFDQAMHILCLEKDLVNTSDHKRAPLRFSRYADNCAFTSPESINFDLLQMQVGRFVRGHGLKLSWAKTYNNTPIEYLGTLMYEDEVTLVEEKLGLYHDALLEALHSPNPQHYYKTIVGQFSWLQRITSIQPSVSDELDKFWDMYKAYFTLCRKFPAKAKKFFNPQEQYGFDFED